MATAHPTFERYFLLVTPFGAILAVAGLYAVGVRLSGPDRPMRAAYFLIAILTLGLGKALYEDSDSYSWKDTERSPIKWTVSRHAAPLYGPTS